MTNSNDIFLEKMKGVNPIKKKNKIQKTQPNTIIKNQKKKHTDKIEINTTKTKKNRFSKTKSTFSLENLSIKKNIKKGSLSIDKKIDFHGKNLLESEEKFSQSIINYYQKNLRCLLFVTGKGLYNSKNTYKEDRPRLYHGVIRAEFVKWVKLKKFSKYILSYEGASPEHGGEGAFYVYLRKKKN